jgi:hypothetical protein
MTNAQSAISTVSSNSEVAASRMYERFKINWCDDVGILSQQCVLLNEWRITSSNYYALNAQPVYQSIVCALLAAGLLQSANDLAQMSRAVMDTGGSPAAALLARVFSPAQIESINRTMDTLPGKTRPGGFEHRVQSGHDLAALADSFRKANVEAAATWFVHVVGRDFWTPDGIPYLPAGSKNVFAYLTKLGVSRHAAASVLSINVWQVMGVVLFYNQSAVVVQHIRDALDEVEAERLFDRGNALYAMGNYRDAEECYNSMLARIPKGKPEVELWVAIRFMEIAVRGGTDQALWRQHLLRAYTAASAVQRKCAQQDQTVILGGVELSMNGLAVLTMASAWAGVLGEQDVYTIDGELASGIEDLVARANEQRARRVCPRRPLSAVANDALALRLLYASPFVLRTTITPEVLHTRVTTTLNELIAAGGAEGDYACSVLHGFLACFPRTPTNTVQLLATPPSPD